MFDNVIATCAWNKSWTPDVLDPCAATSCQEIPFPPKEIGLVKVDDPLNPITMASKYAKYNPSLPLVGKTAMSFPVDWDFCGDNSLNLMIVGKIPSEATEMTQFVFRAGDWDEAFRVKIDPDQEVIQRWGVFNNVSTKVAGDPFDGTTVDRDEPFVVRISCDQDGWVLKINSEDNYPHFFHILPQTTITTLDVTGDVEISYIGFGPDSK